MPGRLGRSAQPDTTTRRRFLRAGAAAGAGLLSPAMAWSADKLPESSQPREPGLAALVGIGTRVSITPNLVWRETPTPFQIVIRLGMEGLRKGEPLGLINGSYIDRWKFGFPSHWWGEEPPWQTNEPAAPNYTTASCSREDVTIALTVGTRGWRTHPRPPYGNAVGHFGRSLRNRLRYVLELTGDGDLHQGDTIVIAWGDPRRGSPGAGTPAAGMNYFFMPFQFDRLPEHDGELPIRRGEYRSLPCIRVRGRQATRFHLACPVLAAQGESFTLTLAALDQYGNAAEDYEGEVALSADGAGIAVPQSVRFTKADRGARVVENLCANKPGWHTITAAAGELSGRSNYVVITEEEPPARLYFGDMHTHTLDCDGTPDIVDHFNHGRHVAGLDFGAVSCHAEYFGSSEAWERYLRETTRAHVPGRFVTFYGYEWASQGHTNAYFLDADDVVLLNGPAVSDAMPGGDAYRQLRRTEADFMQTLTGLKQRVFCIAHCHTAYSPGVDDAVLWLDEIYSCHRRDRAARENRLRRNLERGLRLGVVAGSDQHRLLMGHACKNPGKRWPQGGWENCQYQTAGLQATFATELSREALYEGMQQRHTYGTSGARMVLLFSCNGRPMGSQLRLPPGAERSFRIEIGGTAPLSEVVVCRFDGTQWTEPWKHTPDGPDRWVGTWCDESFDGNGIYYLRVAQRDGEQAWSSPIWIDRDPG